MKDKIVKYKYTNYGIESDWVVATVLSEPYPVITYKEHMMTNGKITMVTVSTTHVLINFYGKIIEAKVSSLKL
jgi:hypothetical protein